jgi:alpha-methylacyl-CoA racemase
LLEGSDACFAPVLSLDEATRHPHMLARKTFIERDGLPHPAPAPRFSRTPAEIGKAADGRQILKSWGAVMVPHDQ